MAVGQDLKKWTWMMDHVEVRGVVRKGGLTDGTELEATDSFDLELDPNYRHLVSSIRASVGRVININEIHVEAYSQSPNRLDNPENINRAEPFYLPDKPASQKFEVRVDKAGNKRPLRAGDHVRLFGRWIIENQHEDQCWTRMWGPGTDDDLKLKVGCVWAELHPFDWQNIELVDALPDKSVETLSLAAPVYEEKYQRGAMLDPAKVWMVDHVFILDDRSNYHHTMSASAYIKAPPPAGSPLGDYKVAYSEQVMINGTGLGVSQVRKIDVLNDGIRVNASVTAPPKVTAMPGLGGWTQQQVADVNDPANNKSVFQARYSAWLVGRRAVFLSQSVPGSMVAGRKYKVSVTMRNAGNDTWTPFGSQYYALGSQSPQDNTTWGLNRVKLAAPVPPGAQTTFSFEVTAPKTPGEHYFQWRMVHEFVEWFGDFTPGGVRVSVSPPTQLQLSYGPAVCSSEPDRDRLDVFVRGTNDTLHYMWFDGQNRSGCCLARCALRTSTVRGPMRILRSLPVLVVDTRVFVRVSAERLTVMEGLPVRSTSSHLRAANSPWRIPVLSARVSRASSHVPTAAPKSLEASSWERSHGRLITLDGLFHAAGWVGRDQAVVHRLVERSRQDSLHHADGIGIQTLLELAGLEGSHVGRTQLTQLDAS